MKEARIVQPHFTGRGKKKFDPETSQSRPLYFSQSLQSEAFPFPINQPYLLIFSALHAQGLDSLSLNIRPPPSIQSLHHLRPHLRSLQPPHRNPKSTQSLNNRRSHPSAYASIPLAPSPKTLRPRHHLPFLPPQIIPTPKAHIFQPNPLCRSMFPIQSKVRRRLM